jgi:adenylate kinase family enzyme
MKRVAVVGVTGSGKSTLAAALAAKLGAACVELDALYWEPSWTPAPTDVFRNRVAAALEAERWVVDGNYSAVRDLVWGQADSLVWLDYKLPVIFARLLRRTIRRVSRGEALWNGNRERFAFQFLSRDSLFLWALKTHPKHRATLPALLASEPYRHLAAVRLASPSVAQAWLDAV